MDAGQRDDVGDGPAGDTQCPLGVARCRAVLRRLSFEPRNASQQRGKGRRRLDDQVGQRVRTTMGLEVRLSQMKQMAAGLHLARAADIGRVEPRRRERIRAGDNDVIREDRTELQRKGVQ